MRRAPAAWGLALLAATGFVHAGALAYSFSQDDFTWLAQAAGLLPRPEAPWRILQQVVFDAGWALFGADPRPWHVASLVAHGACALLLWAVLRTWVSRPAAAVGAAFFATHPALYTAVYWVAAIADPLALGFALATILLARRRDRWRWAALATFASSIAAKEATLLLPLFLLAVPPSRGTARVARDALPWLLLATAAIFFAWLTLAGWGVRPQHAADAAYAAGPGSHVWKNFLTYAGWSVQVPGAFIHGFSDAIDPDAFGWGIALVAAWIVGCASPALRARGWVAAGLWFLLAILPVLPLRNHTYHYYAYAALPGVAWLAAALVDLVFVRVARRRAVPSLTAIAVIALLALNGRAVVRKIETMPLGDGPLRADPTVDRALVMDRVAEGVRRARLPQGTRLRFWSPARLVAGAPPEAPDTYWERNVRAATAEGVAVRVLFPQVSEVEFVRELKPGPADVRYAVFGIDGRTDVFTWSTLDSILHAGR